MTKKDIVKLLQDAGDNLVTGEEAREVLEARLADSKENGVMHLLTAEDLEANPDLAKPSQEGEEPLKVGDEIRIPWPVSQDDNLTDEEKAKIEAAKQEEARIKEEQEAAEAAKEKAKAEKEAAKEAERLAKAESETVMVELLNTVKHAGKLYYAGQTLEVTVANARILRAAGAVK